MHASTRGASLSPLVVVRYAAAARAPTLPPTPAYVPCSPAYPVQLYYRIQLDTYLELTILTHRRDFCSTIVPLS